MSAPLTLCLSPYRPHRDPSPVMGGPVRVETWELAIGSKLADTISIRMWPLFWAHLAWRVDCVALEQD